MFIQLFQRVYGIFGPIRMPSIVRKVPEGFPAMAFDAREGVPRCLFSEFMPEGTGMAERLMYGLLVVQLGVALLGKDQVDHSSGPRIDTDAERTHAVGVS